MRRCDPAAVNVSPCLSIQRQRQQLAVMADTLLRRGKPVGGFDPAAVDVSSRFCIEIKGQQLPKVRNTLLHWKFMRRFNPTTVNVGASLSIQIEGQQFPVQRNSRFGFRKLLPHRHPA